MEVPDRRILVEVLLQGKRIESDLHLLHSVVALRTQRKNSLLPLPNSRKAYRIILTHHLQSIHRENHLEFLFLQFHQMVERGYPGSLTKYLKVVLKQLSLDL